MLYEFEWDEAKRLANLEKHGLDLMDIVGLDLLAAVVIPDRRRDYGEERFRAFLRVDGAGRAVSFT